MTLQHFTKNAIFIGILQSSKPLILAKVHLLSAKPIFQVAVINDLNTQRNLPLLLRGEKNTYLTNLISGFHEDMRYLI